MEIAYTVFVEMESQSHHAQLEDSNELFQKLLEDLKNINKELIECNHPTFFDDNHSFQYEENLENSSNSNQEKEGPPQDYDIQLYCMLDNVDDLIESALSSKLLSVNLNSQRLNKEMQEIKNVMEQPTERGTRIIESLQNFRVIHKSSISLNNTSQISLVYAIAPILSTKEPKYSPSMRHEHPNTTPKIESDEIIKSGVEELVQILSENEVTSENKRECDVPICENSLICDDHSEIFSDSKNDDDISSDENAFDDIEYVEASLPDPEIVSVEEENVVHQEEEEHAQLEDSNELFQKLLEDLKNINKELIECNHPTFFDDNHSFQYEENLENSSNSNQEKEGPPQDYDIQLYCMLDNVDDLIESALGSKLLSVNLNSQRLNKEMQEIKNVMEQPTERGTRIIESLQNFRVIHKSSISLNNTSQISLSGVEELVQILSENEVTSENKRECDVPICENSLICDDHSEIFSDSKNDDDISSDENAFDDIEYVEASLPDPEIVSVEEENVVHQEEEEERASWDWDNSTWGGWGKGLGIVPVDAEFDNSLLDNFSPEFETFCCHTKETRSGNTTTHVNDSLPEYDSFLFEIEPNQERLINVVKNDISDDSSNDPLLEEANLFLASDNSIPPGIENFGYDSEGDILPRPPPEPPDADFELDEREEILVVMNDSDELECLGPRDEFDVSTNEDDYFPFMFDSEVFSFLLSAKSEDTIFDPGISV
uniref:Uncharacterized protein n=1 Tax=Tanacetum cinerariifolium TaxID=118510 RepID=A0A6L2KMT0_TANCI|nr:hypothetical protein [Tanacetum cinerariifolium]